MRPAKGAKRPLLKGSEIREQKSGIARISIDIRPKMHNHIVVDREQPNLLDNELILFEP
jgi:hypothetical protein